VYYFLYHGLIAFAFDYSTVDILPDAISCYATYDQHSPLNGLLIIQVWYRCCVSKAWIVVLTLCSQCQGIQ